MDERIKNAEDRLRQHYQAIDALHANTRLGESPYWDDIAKALDKLALDSDLELLAEAWLAEKQADDSEPITEEWLERMGLVERYETPQRLRRSVAWDEGEVHVNMDLYPETSTWEFSGGSQGARVWKFHVTTKGEVRQLLRMLRPNTMEIRLES